LANYMKVELGSFFSLKFSLAITCLAA